MTLINCYVIDIVTYKIILNFDSTKERAKEIKEPQALLNINDIL